MGKHMGADNLNLLVMIAFFAIIISLAAIL